MKKIIIAMFALLLCIGASAQSADGLKEGDPQVQTQKEVMYKIIKDETLDGVRYVTAVPSEKVCSKQIDITIKIDSVGILTICIKAHVFQAFLSCKNCRPGKPITIMLI